MPRSPLRVAFAGAGLMSQFHLAGWRQLDDVEIVAICDPEASKARSRAKEFGIPAVFTDFETMLAETRPDAVDIATPVDTHAALVRIAADHGVHASSQKPVTGSASWCMRTSAGAPTTCRCATGSPRTGSAVSPTPA
jgi:predicted dehydrogenase